MFCCKVFDCQGGAFPPDPYTESRVQDQLTADSDSDCCSPDDEVVIDSKLTEPARECTESFGTERCASWCMVVGPLIYDGGECVDDTCVCRQLDEVTESDSNVNGTQLEQWEQEDEANYVDLERRMHTFDEHQQLMKNKPPVDNVIKDLIGVVEEDNAS